MKSDFKKRLWISVGIIFTAIIAAVIAVYFFSNEITTQAAAIVETKEAILADNNVANNLAALKEGAPAAAAYSTAIDQVWTDENGLIAFQDWLTGVAQTQGVSAQYNFNGASVDPAGSTPGSQAVTITAQGTLGQVTNFMKYMESDVTGFLVSFDSFQLTYQTPNYTLTATGNVYFR